MYIEESIWGYVIMIGIVLIGLIHQEIKIQRGLNNDKRN